MRIKPPHARGPLHLGGLQGLQWLLAFLPH